VQGITIVGPGRMGGALAYALSAAGERIDRLAFRVNKPPRTLISSIDPTPDVISIDKISLLDSEILFITTQDEQIDAVTQVLADKVQPGTIVFHTSGSMSSEILKPFAERGCSTASIHPLASITNWRDGIERFRGAYFCLEGNHKAISTGKQLVKKLGGRPFSIKTNEKALYHAAAVTAAGHVTALFDMAVSLMVKTGLERTTARKILVPLLLSVAQNLTAKDTPVALTGTYSRGDEETLVRHINALKRHGTKSESSVYFDLALRSIDIAVKNGLDPKKAARMRRTIKIAKDALR
jgi:predicted short-subunit dehydrogenase-like oxidoreductase (DUF2520 family)